VRAVERHAALRRRELVAQAKQAERDRRTAQREQARAADRAYAEHEVGIYENHCEYLKSMHKDCGPRWDWQQVVSQNSPTVPQPLCTNQLRARAELDAYQPSFWDNIFGLVAKKRTTLEIRIAQAQREDAAAFAQLQADYALQLERHQWETRVAIGILRGDVECYREALEGLDPFAELSDARVSVDVVSLQRDVATLQCLVDKTILPEDEKKLTSSRKLTTRALAQTAMWAMYQEFVASCALRVGREVFAILPVGRVIVNVAEAGIEASTGQNAMLTLLAVSLEREVLESFRFESIDPVASLRNLPNRISFKKSTGFEPVEPMTERESFMTMSRTRA
jgi:hypothetical protein